MQRHQLFILRHDGHGAYGDLPGAAVYAPPRRPHRRRRRDLLLIYLHQEGNAPLSAKEQKALLDKLAARYFSQGSSTTAAMKALASALNGYFLNRNRKLTGQGKQQVGWLALAVWRTGTLYLALSGPMHAVVLGASPKHYHEPTLSGRGLGLGRSARVYFASVAVQPGDALLLTPHLPAAWREEETLHMGQRRLIAPLLRRLMAYRGEAEAVLWQVRSGEGESRRVVLGKGEEAKPSERRTEAPARKQAPSSPAASSAGEKTPSSQPSSPAAAREEAPRPTSTDEPRGASLSPPPSDAPPPPRERPAKRERQPKQPSPSPRRRVPRPAVGKFFRYVGENVRRVGAAVWRGGEKVTGALSFLAGHSLSTSAEEVFALPQSFMALLAVAIPLVVVTIAVVVFIRRGRLQQFQAYLARAQSEAQQSAGIQDPLARRNALAQALADIQAAETYYRNDASSELHAQIRGALDRLDGIQRLDFVPVADRLPRETHVQRLLFQGADLYALVRSGQEVYHFRLEGQRYRRDPDFRCQTSEFATMGLRPLVDIALLTLQPYANAYSVVGVDDVGHVLLCGVDRDPTAFALPPVTPSNWKRPRAVDYQDGSLYVLDPPNKAVEIVDMDGEGQLSASPYNAFTNGAPPGVENALTLTVMRGGFYLLYQDGQIVRCDTTPDGGIACAAVPYNDTRPGRGHEPVVPDTRFTQVVVTSPPDPSLYLLDVQHGAIYRFSYQLRFVAQYRPREPLEEEISAFAIDPETQTLFVVAGQTIYQATLR